MNKLQSFKEYVKSKFNKLADWVSKHAPSKPKIVDYVYDFVREKIQQFQEKKKTRVSPPNPKKVLEIRESDSAMKGFTKRYTIDGSEDFGALSFLNVVEPQVTGLLSRSRQTKVNLVLTCTMERADMKTGEIESVNVPFCSKTGIILDSTDVTELYRNAVDKIMESMASFQMRGSSWRFRCVAKLDINTVVYRPLRGNSYIPLSKELASKQAIVNMKNEDNQCFKWCITRALNPVQKNAERIDKNLRKQAEEFNWENITFPVSLSDIDKFERV